MASMTSSFGPDDVITVTISGVLSMAGLSALSFECT